MLSVNHWRGTRRGVRSGYTHRPPRTHTSLFVRLKIDPDHLTHFFETGASWYLILRPQSSVNGVAGGYIRAENGGLAHSLALVFTRLNAAQKGEWAARPHGPAHRHARYTGRKSIRTRKSPWIITLERGEVGEWGRDRRTLQSVG